MTLWIILGVLIFVVATFLVVASILDKKKIKKKKDEEFEHLKDLDSAKGKVITWIYLTIRANEKALASFKPSVGKLKMSDIRNMAKESINKIKNKKPYKLISKDKDANLEVLQSIRNLEKTNSNIWSSARKEDLDYFMISVKKIEKKKYADFIEKAKKEISEVYSNDNSK